MICCWRRRLSSALFSQGGFRAPWYRTQAIKVKQPRSLKIPASYTPRGHNQTGKTLKDSPCSLPHSQTAPEPFLGGLEAESSAAALHPDVAAPRAQP